MSDELRSSGDAAPRRSAEAVIADYLKQFAEPDDQRETPGPEASGLIRWLRDEGWEIRSALES